VIISVPGNHIARDYGYESLGRRALARALPHRRSISGPGTDACVRSRHPTVEAIGIRHFADLVEQPPYGVGWWAPHPGAKRRILISDQLYACTASVADNMVEAGLHWLEFLDQAEHEDSRYADVIKIRGGKIIADPPRCDSPLDELGATLVRMHVVGVVRALSGALDCLAGAVIGVSALPQDILRADFKKVQSGLQKMRDSPPPTLGRQRQDEFGKCLDDHVAPAGPKGWLDWMLAFRNMLVHRGRRVELGPVPSEGCRALRAGRRAGTADQKGNPPSSRSAPV